MRHLHHEYLGRVLFSVIKQLLASLHQIKDELAECLEEIRNRPKVYPLGNRSLVKYGIPGSGDSV
jgi:predicted component of type VI protein secretion system